VERIVGRHELRNLAGEPVVGPHTPFSHSNGRHHQDPEEAADTDTPTERILSEPLRWLLTPAEELCSLVNTEPMPAITAGAQQDADRPLSLPRREPRRRADPPGRWEPPMTGEQLGSLLAAMKRKWQTPGDRA
jgi:hypothetical protein